MLPTVEQVNALEETIPLVYTRLERLCRTFAQDAADVDDLVQETFLEAWRNVHKLTDTRGCAAWLCAIAFNVCRRWREYGRRQRYLLSLLTNAAEGFPSTWM